MRQVIYGAIALAAYAAALGRKKVFDELVRRGVDLYAVDNTGRSIARHLAESVANGSHFARPSDKKVALRIANQMLDTLPAQPEDELLLILAIDAASRLEEKLTHGVGPDTMIEGAVGIVGLTLDDLRSRVQQSGGLIESISDGTLIPSVTERDRQVDGLSLLMWAVAMQSTECIKLLLKHGADPTRTNSAGMSALSIAKHFSGRHMEELLLCDHSEDAAIQRRWAALGVREQAVRTRASELEEVCRRRAASGESQFYVWGNWELASLYHVLHAESERDEILAAIADEGARLFLSCKRPTSDIWLRDYPIALASASACGNWATVEELLQALPPHASRGQRSRKYNPEYYEWPIWKYLSAKRRGKRRAHEAFAEMRSHSTRKSKAMRAAVQAIEKQDAAQLCRAVNRILAAQDAYDKDMWNHTPPELCLCAEASFLLFFAEDEGLEFKAEPAWALRTIYPTA